MKEESKKVLPEDSTPEESKQEGLVGGKTFTQEQLDEILQERLAREKKLAEQEKLKAVEIAKKEAERLATLTQEEKQKELSAKQQEELLRKETELKLRENKLDAQAKLDELKIPIKFAEFVIDADAEVMNKRIETLSENWSKALNEAVAQQLAGQPPKDFSKSNTSTEKKKLIASF